MMPFCHRKYPMYVEAYIISKHSSDATSYIYRVVMGADEQGNDNSTNDRLLDSLGPDSLHISCSTVSPSTSRKLASVHLSEKGAAFVGAPVFARPDGLSRKQAYFVVGGDSKAIARAR